MAGILPRRAPTAANSAEDRKTFGSHLPRRLGKLARRRRHHCRLVSRLELGSLRHWRAERPGVFDTHASAAVDPSGILLQLKLISVHLGRRGNPKGEYRSCPPYCSSGLHLPRGSGQLHVSHTRTNKDFINLRALNIR